VRWHSGVDGSILAATMVLAGDLDRLVMSADGALTLAASGDRVWIWDSIGALIHYEVLDSEVRFADFDETGEQLLLAHGRQVRLLQRVSGGFLEQQRVDGGVNELAACGALSDYGHGWAVAWCDAEAGSARYELYAGLSDELLAEHVQSPGDQGLQNIPQAVQITPSGERAAFATWGGGGDTSELLLLDAAAGELIWSIDLSGSAMDVALDRSGRRIAVAHKETHANQPSATGAVRLYDIGESDLALSEAPRPGGVLSVECLLPEATMTFFLFGEGLQAPVTPPFVQGELWVSMQSRFVVRARRPDASGRASCVLPLPIGLEGATIAVQAVGRVGVGFAASETHLGVIPR